MNGRERFLTALQGGVPDRVPLFETHFGPRFIRHVVGEPVSPHHNVDDQVAVARAVGLDMVWTAPLGFTSFANVQLHGARYQDEWGTRYGTGPTSWPGAWMENTVVNNRTEWRSLRFPDPDLPERTAQARRALDLLAGERAVVGAVRGPFSAAWMLAGIANMSAWIFDDPSLLHEVLCAMGRWNTQLGLSLIRAGVDAIMVHDDWGMNRGTLISPDHWRRFVLPQIAEQVETLAATGTPVIMHSDGNLNAIVEEIMQLPIAAFNPIQRNAGMDLARLKQQYGDRICLIGNVSATETLPQGTLLDVESEVLACLRDAAPGGGYILAPDHSYHDAIPPENVRCVFSTCGAYGTYPLDTAAIEERLTEIATERGTQPA